MPHRTVKSGTERTTTVAGNLSLTWHLALLQLERIPRMCLISGGAALREAPVPGVKIGVVAR